MLGILGHIWEWTVGFFQIYSLLHGEVVVVLHGEFVVVAVVEVQTQMDLLHFLQNCQQVGQVAQGLGQVAHVLGQVSSLSASSPLPHCH